MSFKREKHFFFVLKLKMFVFFEVFAFFPTMHYRKERKNLQHDAHTTKREHTQNKKRNKAKNEKNLFYFT